jgi:hypothetical protein
MQRLSRTVPARTPGGWTSATAMLSFLRRDTPSLAQDDRSAARPYFLSAPSDSIIPMSMFTQTGFHTSEWPLMMVFGTCMIQ